MMAAVPGGKAGFMAISVVAFIVLGSVLEGIPAIVLFGPLLFPIARALGIHEVHYAMVVDLRDGPRPLRAAVRRRLLRGLRDRQGRARPRHRRVWPHLGALLVALIVIAAVPWLSIGFL